jgi:hypothetical protein
VEKARYESRKYFLLEKDSSKVVKMLDGLIEKKNTFLKELMKREM